MKTYNKQKGGAIAWVIIIVIILGLIVYFGRNRDAVINDVDVTNGTATSTETVRGMVLEVDQEAIAFDGPTLVTILTGTTTVGTTTVEATSIVAIPSMGINLCAANENILDVFELATGTEVEARGTVGEDGYVVPCESQDHYFRVVVEE